MVTDWKDHFHNDGFDPLHTLRGRKLNSWTRDLLDELLEGYGWGNDDSLAVGANNLDSLYWLLIMNTTRQDAEG